MIHIPVYGAEGIRAFALIDTVDYEAATRHRWNLRDGYVVTRLRALADGHRPLHSLHRLILGLEPADRRQGHHVNHNPLDNRRENLRAVTSSENSALRRMGAAA